MARKVEFEFWMRDVNASIMAKTGMSSMDLPDMPYRDWYDDGRSPKSAASAAVKAAMDW